MLDMTKRVAMEAAGAGAAAVMSKPGAGDVVMPDEEIKESVAKILIDHGFDEDLVRSQRNEKEQA